MDFANIKRRFDGPAEQLANFVTFPLRAVIQSQARHLATFLREDRETYEPFKASW